jgi:hypothetical protein
MTLCRGVADDGVREFDREAVSGQRVLANSGARLQRYYAPE